MLEKETTEAQKFAITSKAVAACNFQSLLNDSKRACYATVEDSGISFDIKLQLLTSLSRTIKFGIGSGAAVIENVKQDQGALVLLEVQSVKLGEDIIEWTASPYIWVDENGLISIEFGAVFS